MLISINSYYLPQPFWLKLITRVKHKFLSQLLQIMITEVYQADKATVNDVEEAADKTTNLIGTKSLTPKKSRVRTYQVKFDDKDKEKEKDKVKFVTVTYNNPYRFHPIFLTPFYGQSVNDPIIFNLITNPVLLTERRNNRMNIFNAGLNDKTKINTPVYDKTKINTHVYDKTKIYPNADDEVKVKDSYVEDKTKIQTNPKLKTKIDKITNKSLPKSTGSSSSQRSFEHEYNIYVDPSIEAYYEHFYATCSTNPNVQDKAMA